MAFPRSAKRGEPLLQATAEALDDVLTKATGGPAHCVYSAAIGPRVLRQLGFRSIEVAAVHVSGGNAAQIQWTAGRLLLDQPRFALDPKASTFEPSILGDGSLSGHVALIVDGYLVDPSAGQMHRPEMGMEVGPVVMKLRGRDLPSDRFARFQPGGSGASAIDYRKLPGNTVYQRTEIWQLREVHPGFAEMEQRVMDRIGQHLAVQPKGFHAVTEIPVTLDGLPVQRTGMSFGRF